MPNNTTETNLNRVQVSELNALIEKRLTGELTLKETAQLGLLVDKHIDKVARLIERKQRDLALAR